KSLQKLNQLPNRYFILEPSASLQSQQKETLTRDTPELLEKIVWLDKLPYGFEGIIFANEVVDAIPCNRIKLCQGGWRQVGVSVDAEPTQSFYWQVRQAQEENELPEKLREPNSFERGYTTELRPQAGPWLAALAESLSRGHVLLFDYGYGQDEYYHPQRSDGTLRCFSRHIAHSDPLQLVGLQDITAHVDFSELAKAAVSNNLVVEGFTTQAGFLLENGLLDLAQETSELTERFQTSQQVQKLIAPGQMGEIFKVLHLSKNTKVRMPGFSLQNHLGKL
ncbi:MAG: SAM-dependent methyltransferase, partial [Kangiellaceae bacterium]|nr:SAM-dependent methyltransferase [Kangiellaceae bacterium]